MSAHLSQQNHHPTPELPKGADYEKVYAPAEDTFLLMDALELERPRLQALNPMVVWEIGCGSGAVITFVSSLLSSPSSSFLGNEVGLNSQVLPPLKEAFFAASDINPDALDFAAQTARLNHQSVDFLRTDFTRSVRPGTIDLLIFNPPYVVTTSAEVIHPHRGGPNLPGIEASWAGGVNGREVIDRLLPQIQHILSPRGIAYLVVIRENNPEEILSRMVDPAFGGFVEGRVVMARKAGWEGLCVLCFSRPLL